MCYTCLPIYCEILFREVYYSQYYNYNTLQSSFLKTIVSPHSLSILCTRWALSPLLCCSTQKGKKHQQYLLVFLYLVLYTRFRLLNMYNIIGFTSLWYLNLVLCVKKKSVGVVAFNFTNKKCRNFLSFFFAWTYH